MHLRSHASSSRRTSRSSWNADTPSSSGVSKRRWRWSKLARLPEQLEIEECAAYLAQDGSHPYPYQIRSAKFFEQAGLNGVCAHEMGVGKMVISCLLMKRNRKETTPTLYVCKAGLKYQAFMEIVRWTGIIPQVIESSNDLPMFDFFSIIIVSYDTLRILRPRHYA